MRPSIYRSVYGGGSKGGSWSQAAKLKTVKRLLRMLVRVVLGPSRVTEYDALVDRFERLSPNEREDEILRQKRELKKILDR